MDYPGRLQRIRERMAAAAAQALLVSGPANVRYLSGFASEDGWLVILPDRALLVSDFRYALQAQEQAPGFEFLQIKQMIPDLASGLKELGVERLAFDPARLTVKQHGDLSAHWPGTAPVEMPGAVEELRAVKDADEIALIRRAAALADAAMEHLLDRLAPGKTERELALEVEFFVRANGADHVSFDVIVASGPRAAMPHALPTDRRIERGDTVILDLGARRQGYCSDLTRTAAIAKASPQAREAYRLCLQAQQAGLAALRAGAPCLDVDAAARSVIDSAGYGDRFGHGLGHGVGLEIHEDPRLAPTETTACLSAGNVVTVEPGIYLPGIGGVRIEDLALVTANGVEVLSSAAKPETIPEV